jgi:hypothetical protein
MYSRSNETSQCDLSLQTDTASEQMELLSCVKIHHRPKAVVSVLSNALTTSDATKKCFEAVVHMLLYVAVEE